ncbi:MAG: hypothetical protein R3A46_15110 [Thermomicrobiales bacterium]
MVAYARNALDIVVKHRGLPVYTGGDDVLAFLPLDTAIACADELRRDFPNTVKPQRERPPTERGNRHRSLPRPALFAQSWPAARTPRQG